MKLRRVLIRTGWGLLGLITVVLAGAGAFWLHLSSSLPKIDGTMHLAGLDAPVTVTRDKFGIPTIRAQNQHDANFALGFVQAQDRLVEMEMLRRYGEGRVAAWAGKSELKRDEFMRTLGFRRRAEQDFAGLSKPVRQALQAYAAGVDAYIKYHAGSQRLIYYAVPGPRKWHPVDTLVIAKVLAWYLTQNYHEELLHAELLSRMSKQALAELFPSYPRRGLVTLSKLARIYRTLPLTQLAALQPPTANERAASNNWVVDGAHSSTGKPILANDPHLLYSAPSVWYLARLITPHLHLAGGMIPGAPLFVVGHNSHVGWGFTETGGDVEDLFIEKLNPKNPDEYLTPEGWKKFKSYKQTIHVAGSKPVTITVRTTRHGPVVSDVIRRGGERYVLALQATFLQPNDKTVQAMWEMNRAQNWQQFKAATRDFVAPQMNIVFADTQGTIAFTAPGRIPIRKHGDDWIPHPGWTGEYDWTGYIPFSALPRQVNPPFGEFISANNKIVPKGYPYFITSNWVAPYRADRIAQLLNRNPKQTPADSARIQADTVSLAARQLLPLMLQANPLGQLSQQALDLLRHWNGNMRRHSPAPLIFVAWVRALNRALFQQKLGPEFDSYWKMHALVLDDLLTQSNAWCSHASGKQPRSCDRLLSVSLQQAVQALHKRYGGMPSSWRWGEAHQAYFWSMSDRFPVIGGWTKIKLPVGGSQYTIDAGYMHFSSKQHPYQTDVGPGYREILNFADLAQSKFLFAPGESGNFFSSHRTDLLKRWRAFRYIDFAHDPVKHTLKLLPQSHS